MANQHRYSSATMGPTRIEKAFAAQKRKATQALESSFPIENNAEKKRRPPPVKKKSTGGARVLDQGADLHYGKNNNGFSSARLNGKGIEDDPHLLGDLDRLDDEVPSLDSEQLAGCKDGESFRPPEESENESNDEGAKIEEDLMGHLRQEQRQRVKDRIKANAGNWTAEKAVEKAAALAACREKYGMDSEDEVLDESGKGAGDAIAHSRGNASGAAPSSWSKSSGGGGSIGNASGGAPLGSKAPPPRGSNATTLSRQPPRHVPGEEPADENVNPAAESKDEDERLALVLRRRLKRKSKSKCLLYRRCQPLSRFIIVVEGVCALVLSRGARIT
jgi:hypothetical protein